jgi:predicted anti-sigma-YlaC factor YlaD
MRCEQCREIISAHADGEDQPGEWIATTAHLDRCGACRAFAAGTADLQRFTRLRPVTPVPDLTNRIVEATDADRARGNTTALRIVLALAAVLQIALAVPALVLGDDANAPAHIARHLGSFDVALAVGYLWVAWRPARALEGVFPIAVVLVACLVGSSILDVVSGRAAASNELHHLTDLVGVTAMWLLGPRFTLRVGASLRGNPAA